MTMLASAIIFGQTFWQHLQNVVVGSWDSCGITPVRHGAQREQPDRPPIYPPAYGLRHVRRRCLSATKNFFHLHSVPQGGAEDRNVGHHLEDILVKHGCDTGKHAAFASLDRAARDQRGSSGSYQVGVARWWQLREEIGCLLNGALVSTHIVNNNMCLQRC